MKCSKEYRLKHTEEARAIVNRLSLEEKVSLMSGDMPLDKILAESRTSPEKHYNYIPCSAQHHKLKIRYYTFILSC